MTPSAQQLIEEGQRHHAGGNLAAAEQCYRQAMALQPNHPQALYLLAMIALASNAAPAAVELFGQALQSNPTEPAIRVQLAQALQQADRPDEALSLTRALATDAHGSQGHYALAMILYQQNRLEESIASAERALALRPDGVEELLLLSVLYPAAGRWGQARQTIDHAARLHPQVTEVQWNHAISLLSHGDMTNGWKAFQHRPHLAPPQGRKLWEQQDLRDQTILLYCEGGFGDAIQFVRYVPMVNERAKKVMLVCPDELLGLFKQVSVDQLLQQDQPVPPFDYVCPLQSLPFNFQTTLETVPCEVPYLRADPRVSKIWSPHLAGDGFKVGLAWAGSMTANQLRSRSIQTFAPLADVSGVTFYSLQKGPESWQAAAAPTGMRILDLMPRAQDFADLAAIIEHLDLVITVDTSVAHLAGAMGKPVWTLITQVPDFRWMRERTDSPWYPTMRLYRQTSRADFAEPITRMAADLAAQRNGAA